MCSLNCPSGQRGDDHRSWGSIVWGSDSGAVSCVDDDPPARMRPLKHDRDYQSRTLFISNIVIV